MIEVILDDVTPALQEAATFKTLAQRLMRDMDALLATKDVPPKLRTMITDMRRELKRTWKDLKDEAVAWQMWREVEIEVNNGTGADGQGKD